MKLRISIAVTLIFSACVMMLSACGLLSEKTPIANPLPTKVRLPTNTPTTTPIPYVAEEILSIGTSNMQAAASMKFMMTNNIHNEKYGGLASGNGELLNPDQFYFMINYGGDGVEIVGASQTEFFIRSPGDTLWIPIPAEGIRILYTVTSPLEQMKLSDVKLGVQKLGNEEINGVDCYHIRIEIDMEKYISMIGSEVYGPIDLREATGLTDIWVGTDDMLFHKTQTEIVSEFEGSTISVKEKWTFFDFNQPVEIPKP